MWMDVYVEEILIRERIAEAQQRAARNHELRGPQRPSSRRGLRAVASRLLRRYTHLTLRERRV